MGEMGGGRAAGSQPPAVSGQGGGQKKVVNEYNRIFDDNVLLINPKYDCSDKELHQRNGFKSAGANIYSFFSNGDKAVFVNDVFKPDRLGDFTKDNQGQIKNMLKAQNKMCFDKRAGAAGDKLKPISLKKGSTHLSSQFQASNSIQPSRTNVSNGTLARQAMSNTNLSSLGTSQFAEGGNMSILDESN